MNKVNNYDDYAESISRDILEGSNRAHKYIEKPAMYAVLPKLSNLKVLSIGCGIGEECGYLNSQGADVIGIDKSKESIKIAKNLHPSVNFMIMDMNNLNFPADTFNLVYSSLTLHYAKQLADILLEIKRILVPGGKLIFSTLHPIKWGSEIHRDLKDERKKSFMLGYDSFVKPSVVYGDYLNPKLITQKPEGYPVIEYWNRSISEYLKIIREAGLELIDFIEPIPIDELKQADPDYWNIHSKIPQFMIFILQKKNKD